MLIQDIDALRRVISVSSATDFDRVEPHLFTAEQKYIKPLLGDDFYNHILPFANDESIIAIMPGQDNTPPDIECAPEENDSGSSGIFDETFDSSFQLDDEGSSPALVSNYNRARAWLLYYIQKALAHLAYFEGFNLLNAYVSDGGFKRLESDGAKSLFKYQEDNIRKYFHNTGLNGLDVMLAFIERHPSCFSEFDSQLHKLKGHIIANTAEYNNIININDSRIVFMRLRQHMRTVEQLQLTSIVGVANMKAITEGLNVKPRPAKITGILPYLQNVVAYLSSIMLMEETGADLTDRGLYFEGIKGGLASSDVRMPTEESRVMSLVKRNRGLADAFILQLQRYMEENASDWDDYENPRSRVLRRDNAGKKTFWA